MALPRGLGLAIDDILDNIPRLGCVHTNRTLVEEEGVASLGEPSLQRVPYISPMGPCVGRAVVRLRDSVLANLWMAGSHNGR